MTRLLPRVGHASVDEVTIDQVVFNELRTFGVDFLADLVDLFVHETEPLLVQLSEALEAGDHTAVGRIAHSICGSGGQLGGQRLALSCGRLEEKATAGCVAEDQDDLQEVEFEYKKLCRVWTQRLAAMKVGPI